MDKIPFMKLSGAGNDFLIINNLAGIVDSTDTNFVTKLCQRRMVGGCRRCSPRRAGRRC